MVQLKKRSPRALSVGLRPQIDFLEQSLIRLLTEEVSGMNVHSYSADYLKKSTIVVIWLAFLTPEVRSPIGAKNHGNLVTYWSIKLNTSI